MHRGQIQALPCVISRAGFSSERTFSLKPIGIDHKGGTYRGHLWNADETQVPDEEMPLGKEIPGFVAARIL